MRAELPVVCVSGECNINGEIVDPHEGWMVFFIHHVYKRLPAPRYYDDRPLASFQNREDAKKYLDDHGGSDVLCMSSHLVRHSLLKETHDVSNPDPLQEEQ